VSGDLLRHHTNLLSHPAFLSYRISVAVIIRATPEGNHRGRRWRQSSGYRAWIRTMNNASKGRCVTVTPRGKARTKHLRQNPGFARGNIGTGSKTENAFHRRSQRIQGQIQQKVTETTEKLEVLEGVFSPPSLWVCLEARQVGKSSIVQQSQPSFTLGRFGSGFCSYGSGL
jgi:hypothetical protein